ncbi:ubiquitin-like-conjugating enzyme ATG10 [Conger conger]|uniref:ubiquitin-like-conjugating enzyme ATG10 n=1 Tax=Conger conger TaxID=82655 RepID=UPI002A5A9D22|nr:ubiquitin-like-conjugating enzyme ATG10 [Conger conger]
MTGEGGEGTGALHLDEETFRRACQRFVQHSRTLSDGWSWEEVKGSDEGYMRKTVLVPGRTIAHPPRDAGCGPGEDLDTLGQGEGQDFQDEEEVEEQAVGDEEQATSETTSAIRYEYHVLYSCSYQAPVLYFRASMLDGRPLSLEDMWGNVHPNYRQRLLQGPWDTITQQEHPLLGQPFFVLHPCRSQDLMRPLLAAASAENRSLNYIVSWLSSVGPVVALTIPLSYAHIDCQSTEEPE